MLRSHSMLWHYLWLGPHFLQAILAIILWRRGWRRAFPIFFAYLVFEAVEEFTLYAMDMLPSVSGKAWVFAFGLGVVIEGALQMAVVSELFFHLIRSRPAIAKISKCLITATGAVLVLVAAAVAAYVPTAPEQYLWSQRWHVLQQSFYIVDGGLVLFLFMFVAYSKLSWSRNDFGVALGFGILFCEHMATLSIMATGALPYRLHPLLDFLNMATYHICVLIWCYYLLIPLRKPATSAIQLPETNLAAWNRELERLIQK